MAIATTTVWEVRQTATANMVNGGGFNASNASAGTDYSLQNAAQLTGTDLTCTAGSTTVTSATGGFTNLMPGNIIHLTALTGTGALVGWYEVVTFVDTNNITLDRTPTNGVNNITAGTFFVGGALGLNSTLDDDFFEQVVGGNTIWVRYNATAYLLGETVSISSASGTATAPIIFEGYNTTRGDNPIGANRPTINAAAITFSFVNSHIYPINVIMTATTTATMVLGPGSFTSNCKYVNTSTTANRTALSLSTGCTVFNCEFISLNGPALQASTSTRTLASYMHDSNIGYENTSARAFLINSIVAHNRTAQVRLTSTTAANDIVGCTIYGREGKQGVGIDVTGATNPANRFYNNIIYGCTTGIAVATLEQGSNRGDYNDFFNNTSNATNYTLGDHDLTSDPTFTAVSQITGTTATTSGSVLTQSGGDFSTVTDGVSYLHVLSGTGVTVGSYSIVSHTGTTITTNNALGTSSGGDVVYYISIGTNFAIGTNLKAAGFPGAFNGSGSTGYLDTGGVQRQEPAGGGSGGAYTSS